MHSKYMTLYSIMLLLAKCICVGACLCGAVAATLGMYLVHSWFYLPKSEMMPLLTENDMVNL